MNQRDLIARIVKETRVSEALASRMVAAALGSITKPRNAVRFRAGKALKSAIN